MALFLIIVLTMMSAPSGFAGSDSPTGERVTLIVEMEEGGVIAQSSAPSASMRKAVSAVRTMNAVMRDQSDVQKKIQKTVDPGAVVNYTYTHLFNGFSIETYAGNIDAISAMDGVKAVYISVPRSLRARGSAVGAGNALMGTLQRTVENSSKMTQVSEMHADGYNGEGMVIAIVDSEFDLGSAFLTTELDNIESARYKSAAEVQTVIDGTELNARTSAARAWKNSKVPFAWEYSRRSADTYSGDPDQVHGSHVAGIAAGKGGMLPLAQDGTTVFDGVAPEAQLLLLSSLSFTDETLLAAIDDAAKLGADVINLSWGSDYAEDQIYKTVFDNAVKAGILLYNAAGNMSRGFYESKVSPSMPDYGSMGSPGNLVESAVSVASADNTAYLQEAYFISVDSHDIPYSDQNEDMRFNTVSGKEFVYCGVDNKDNLDINEKIAVFDKGVMDFSSRVQEIAKKGGAAGVLFILNEGMNIESTFIRKKSTEGLPVAAVSHSDGEYLKNGGTMTVGSEKEWKIVEREPAMTFFSAWGVFSDLTLAPDITTPGRDIYSSVPTEESPSGYENMSGTSMASPHMTGAAALLKQYLLKNEAGFSEKAPEEQIIEINMRSMSTAAVMMNPDGYDKNDPSLRLPYSPRQQGAGLLQMKDAAKTPVVLEGDTGRAKISLRDIGNSFTVSFTAHNYTSADVVYNSVSMALFTDSVEDNVVEGSHPLKYTTELPGSVTVPANGNVEISFIVSLDPDETAELMEVFTNGFYVDGYVFLEAVNDDDPDLSIPFMGFYGGWDSAPVLDKSLWSDDAVLGHTKLSSVIGSRPIIDEDYDMSYDMLDAPLGCNTELNELLEIYDTVIVGYESNQIYDDERFGGISPNGDGAYDYLFVDVVPLRSAAKAKITIIADTEKELVFEDNEWRSWIVGNDHDYGSETGLSKFWANLYSLRNKSLKTYAELEEGNYSVKIEAWRTENSAEPETLTMPFYVDLTEPEITGAALRRENGKAYIDVSAKDNCHISSIKLLENDEEIPVQFYPVPGSSEAEYSFDITELEIEPENIIIEVTDYAMNAASKTFPTYTVVFDPNGGELSVTSAKTDAYGQVKAFPVPTREGSYVFDGWYTVGGAKATTDTVFMTDTALIAHWRYTGGSSAPTSPSIAAAANDMTISVIGNSHAETVQATVNDGAATLDSLSESAISRLTDNSNNVLFDLSGAEGVKAVKIPTETVKSLAEALGKGDTVTVITEGGEASFDSSALTAVAERSEAKYIELSLEIISAESLRVTLKSGDDRVSKLADGKMTVTIPLVPAEGRIGNNYKVYYVAENGELEKMPSDFGYGKLSFTTDHFSDYAITYEVRPFTDVPESAWYYNAVYHCFDNSYFRGVSEDRFAPDGVMTRAMFAAVLYRMAGEPEVNGENAFSDVESGQWYTDAVIWAAKNDIISGYGDGKFGTNDPVTREQIVTIIWRYNLRPETNNASLGNFTDAGAISDWAADAMQWAVREGIINGNGNNMLNPKMNASRAEVAQIILNCESAEK